MKVYRRGSSKPRNAEVAAYLEYGVKEGNAPRSGKPFVTKAMKDAQPKVLAKMQEVFEREAGK